MRKVVSRSGAAASAALLVFVALVPALGQQAAQPTAQPAHPPQATEAAGSTSKTSTAANLSALAELNSLRTAQTLQLDKTKAASILKTVDSLDQDRKTFATWAKSQLKTSGPALEAILKAWSPATALTADQRQTLGTFYSDFRGKYADYISAVDKAAATVVSTADLPTGTVETQQEAQARREAERRFEGSPTAAQYVVKIAESLQQLMPDDYHLIRIGEAEDIATRLGDREPGANDPLVVTVLGVLDRLMQTPPQVLANQRDQVLAQVAGSIGERGSGVPPTVTWDHFVAWLEAPETRSAVHDLAGQPLSEKPSRLPRDYLTRVREAELLMFFDTLRLTPDQAGAAGQLMTAVASDDQGADGRRAGLASGAPSLLASVKAAVTKGKAIPSDTADTVKGLLSTNDDVTSGLLVAMVGDIQNLWRLLAPPQREAVYWVPTGAAMRALPPSERSQDLRRQAALISDGLQYLNSIKVQRPNIYGQLKISQTQKFLARYMNPNSPQFGPTMTQLLDIVTQSRFVSMPEWRDGANLAFATRVMRTIGLIGGPAPPPPGNQPYYWQDLYDMFTNQDAATMARGWLISAGT